ncbi:magnesium transporter [Kocuria sp. cx-116]|uniref:magnesium transporter n=1 Tax=Kocuria sp. cx-116 TaxID=2771378 RepID=UPI0016823086|nr:magnesium transporter [Kocuria sp. cx-116]MBD2763192.1 magnesium transporter [Kocuria sp. cx-116]
MNSKDGSVTDRELRTVESAVSKRDLDRVSRSVDSLPVGRVVELLERLGVRDRALVYRMLSKNRASVVFERLDAPLQKELVVGLQDEDVARIFASLGPDDRARLIDELPAAVATRLLRDLPDDERELTSVVLGYPEGSIGRRMNPECVTTHPQLTAEESLRRIRSGIRRAETIYTIPVTDGSRMLVGVVGLRQLMSADPATTVAELMIEVDSAMATEPAEEAARRCADLRLLALPVADHEGRLVGILTVDDALDILENAESEDQARISGSEPLRRPYLSTPVRALVQARVVWLLVLAIGATLTVQVLEVFESTLEQMVVLSVFIPLLIGTGGNTGNQAATSITRALALGDVRPRDVLKVALRELRVGVCLGLLLGAAGLVIAGSIYGVSIGAVIGLTLAAICTLAATVGGLMPLAARAIKVDPAVFSNPFITTFVDAIGLVLYFFIARAILGLG